MARPQWLVLFVVWTAATVSLDVAAKRSPATSVSVSQTTPRPTSSEAPALPTDANNATTTDAYEASPTEKAANSAVRVVGIATVMSFVAMRGSPLSPMLDAQSIGLLSRSRCADAELRYVLGAAAAVAAPLDVLGTDASLLTSVMLQLFIAVLLSLGGYVYGYARRGKLEAQSAELQWTATSKGRRPLTEPQPTTSVDKAPPPEFLSSCLNSLYFTTAILTTSCWPTLPLAFFVALTAPLAFVSMAQLAKDDGSVTDMTFGVFCVTVSAGGFLGFAGCLRLAAMQPSVVFRTYAFLDRWSGIPPEHDVSAKKALAAVGQKDAWTAVEHVRNLPPWLRPVLLPRGYWWPNSFRTSFGVCIDWMAARDGQAFMSVPLLNLLRTWLVCAAMAYPARTGVECAAQHGFVAVLHFVMALVMYLGLDASRLRRRPLLVASAAATALCSIALGHPLLYHLVAPTAAFLCIVWLLQVAFDVAYAGVEWALLRPAEDAVRLAHRELLRRRMRMKVRRSTRRVVRAHGDQGTQRAGGAGADDWSGEEEEEEELLEFASTFDSGDEGSLMIAARDGPISNELFDDLEEPVGPRPLQPQYVAALPPGRLVTLVAETSAYVDSSRRQFGRSDSVRPQQRRVVIKSRPRRHGVPIAPEDDWRTML
jgi:hypothetical protein